MPRSGQRTDHAEVFLVFPGPETKANICFDPEIQIPPDAPDIKISNGIGQFFAVVVIVIFYPPVFIAHSETKRAHRIDVKIAVEFIHTTIGIDHFINKNRRHLMGFSPSIRDTALIL
jgi:hypothetical protein